jgi:hypothetical protein
MSWVVNAGWRARVSAVGVVLGLVLAGCAVPPQPPGGGDPTTTTTTGPPTTAPTTTTTAPPTTAPPTTAPTTTTTTTPPEDTWTPPWNVSPTGWLAMDTPRVSVDRQGDALLAWTACDPSTQYCLNQIQARRQPASGAPDSVLTLSPPGSASAGPEVDSDDSGNAAVVWYQDAQVVGRRISADGQLVGPLQTLSTAAPASTPVVALSPDGDALAAWTEVRDGTWYAVARQLRDDGSIGEPITLGSTDPGWPGIGVDRSGRFVVAWSAGSYVAATRIEQDSASPPQVLTSAIAAYGGFGMVRVGVDSVGEAVISYRSGGGAHPQLWVSRWSGPGTLSDPIDVSSTDNVGFHHDLATDLEGDSMLVWTRWNGDNRIEMLGRQLSRAGTLGAVTSLGLYDRPEIALDDDGDGLLVFHSPSPPYEAQEVGARLISSSGSFGNTQTLTSDGVWPHVDASPNYRFTVAWRQSSNPPSIHAIAGP